MKTIKKIMAVAGATLMATSMVAPVIAASLSDLPQPFISNGVFDANIVVGSSSNGYGIASDLAGAMDIAAAFAQQAVTEPVEAVEGIIPARINSTSGYIGYGDSAMAQDLNASWLVNKSYDDYELTEKLSILNNGGVTLSNEGVFEIDFGALVYSVNSNTTLSEGQEISLFGKEYKITEIDAGNKVVFGEIVEEKGLSMPSSFEITNKATVEIIDMDSVSKDLLIKVTSTNGTVLFDGMMANNGSMTFDDFSFSFKNVRMFSSGAFSIDADWSSSLMTLSHNGNGSVISSGLNDWKVKINSDSISFSSPQYNLNTDSIILNEGEELSVMDYFKVRFEGFDAVNKTELNTYDIMDNYNSVSLSYENINGSTEYAYLGDYNYQSFGDNGLTDYVVLSNSNDVYRFRAFENETDRYVEVFNQETTNLSEPFMTLYNSTNANVTSFAVGKGVYSLNWDSEIMNITLQSWSDVDAKYLSSLNFSRLSDDSSELKMVESDGNSIIISYGNDSIINDIDSFNTDFGSYVSILDSQANIIIPENRITANIWFGRKTSSIEAVDSVMVPVTPGIGKVDVESNEITKPTIIIGGGLANSLTQQLSDDGTGVSTDTLFNATDMAYYQLIENAFNGTQTVLVIAGRDAKDTRLACEALAANIAGELSLNLSGNLIWLNTSSEDYTTISVVE